MKGKKIVHYTGLDFLKVGSCAEVVVKDHPQCRVDEFVFTSEVLAIRGETFETRNSIHAPWEEPRPVAMVDAERLEEEGEPA